MLLLPRSSLAGATLPLLLVAGCASHRPAGSPPILGSTTVPAGYYENAQRTVPASALAGVSTDPTYGLTERNPVKVGGGASGGVRNEQAYLNALRGPAGQPIRYERRGSCCLFKTPNGLLDNTGMLDVYLVSWAGQAKPVTVYLNLYDPGELRAPVGLTLAP